MSKRNCFNYLSSPLKHLQRTVKDTTVEVKAYGQIEDIHI